MRNRLALLDRDGTINVEKNYVLDPGDLELLPNAAAGIRRLRELGLKIAVVTNQSPVGRGLLTRSRLDGIHGKLTALLEAEGARLDGIYVCPHAPGEGCRCRKPGIKLLERAAEELGADLSRSFFVGDKRIDVECGRAAGATTILVTTGYGLVQTFDPGRGPDAHVDDLLGAARFIESAVWGS